MSVNHGQSLYITADIVNTPQLKQITTHNGQMKEVTECQIVVIEVKGNNVFRSTFIVEAYGDVARILAACPQGHTVIVNGKIQNKKYTDQQTGQEKWMTKIIAFSVGNVGPSRMAALANQQQGQGGYQQGYQNNQGGYNQSSGYQNNNRGGHQAPNNQGGYNNGSYSTNNNYNNNAARSYNNGGNSQTSNNSGYQAPSVSQPNYTEQDIPF